MCGFDSKAFIFLLIFLFSIRKHAYGDDNERIFMVTETFLKEKKRT
jgi:hypothetical protein